MSDVLALATVTAALQRQLQDAAQATVPAATVRLGPPTAKLIDETAPLVNLFLYQARPDPQQRNRHLPNRRGDGGTLARNQLALDLAYVVSFYGDDSAFEPERMMASVALTLEDVPILSHDAIAAAIAANPAVLDGANLADALSQVQITPEALSLEDLSRMWSIFFQVPYALSASYLCSHVIVETEAAVSQALPVARPQIWSQPVTPFGIDALTSGDGLLAPVLWGGVLVIDGTGLGTEGLTLQVGPITVAVADGEIAGSRMRLPLTDVRLGTALPAGFHAVQLITPPPGGAPAHLARRSEPRGFALRPQTSVSAPTLGPGTTVDVAEGTFEVMLTPALQAGQSVQILLDERSVIVPQSAGLVPDAPASFPATTLTVPFDGLRRSAFLVTVQVDGVAGAPVLGADAEAPDYDQIVGPFLDLT